MSFLLLQTADKLLIQDGSILLLQDSSGGGGGGVAGPVLFYAHYIAQGMV